VGQKIEEREIYLMYKFQWYRDHVDPKQYTESAYTAYVISKIGSFMSLKFMSLVFKKVQTTSNRKELVKALLIHLKNSKSNYRRGRDISDILNFYKLEFTNEQKMEVVEYLIQHRDNFYAYAKKINGKIAAEFVADSNTAIRLFENYHRLLTPDALQLVLSKIENGIENDEVKKIIENSKTLAHLKYNAEEVKNKPEIKQALLKEIAYTETVAKKLDYALEVSLEDIKTLPPVLRFNFLQFAFRSEINFALRIFPGSYYHRKFKNNLPDALSSCRKKARLENLKVPEISPEEMKEMFFSIALAKNEEVQNWLKKYDKYLEVKRGIVTYMRK
jgi:hypothetical protein